jgi:endonuclease/exonuclease/phosphatase family metal-dependent hydrolase
MRHHRLGRFTNPSPESPMRVATGRSILTIAALCLAAACSDDSVTGPEGPLDLEPEPSTEAHRSPDPDIAVMTRNMYVGADVDAVIAALVTSDPADDQAALVNAIGTLQETDFPSRAAAMAREIERGRPHVVGLQEVSKIDITLPPIGVDLHLDFLPTLLAELSARGLQYDVAVRVRNIEAAPFPGVSLVDEDVILVDRRRVRVKETTSQNFTANIGPVAPGVALVRGWVSATIAIGGRAYTVASTHLESGDAPGLDQLRAAQATELAQALSGAGPNVLMGDLNDVPGSPMHHVLSSAGLTDVWALLQGTAVGHTCCHMANLSNPVKHFTKRIDYVFVRDGRERGAVTGVIRRIGDSATDRFPGPAHPLWPSDHAGLVARLATHQPRP